MHPVLQELQCKVKENIDKEICGLVDDEFNIYPITNVAKNTKTCFVFDRKQYFAVISSLKEQGRKVLFVYHSHPSNNPEPSKADLDYTKRSGIPQIIVTATQYRVVENA